MKSSSSPALRDGDAARGCFASPLYEARMCVPDFRTRVNLLAWASSEPACFSLSNPKTQLLGAAYGLGASRRAAGSFLEAGPSKAALKSVSRPGAQRVSGFSAPLGWGGSAPKSPPQGWVLQSHAGFRSNAGVPLAKGDLCPAWGPPVAVDGTLMAACPVLSPASPSAIPAGGAGELVMRLCG